MADEQKLDLEQQVMFFYNKKIEDSNAKI